MIVEKPSAIPWGSNRKNLIGHKVLRLIGLSIYE
jgi:hypothetical protein